MSSDHLVFEGNVFETLVKQLASLGKLIVDGKRGAWHVASVFQGLLTSLDTCTDAPKSDEKNIFERLFKLSVFIAKLLVDGKRSVQNVVEVLQGIADTPNDVFVTSVIVYSHNATPQERMQRPQEELFRKCLLDLRLWRPFRTTEGQCFYINFVTGTNIPAPLRERDTLVYGDSRITDLMQRYGLDTAWWDRDVYESEGIPLEVKFKAS